MTPLEMFEAAEIAYLEATGWVAVHHEGLDIVLYSKDSDPTSRPYGYHALVAVMRQREQDTNARMVASVTPNASR